MIQKSGRERCDGSQHRREEEAAQTSDTAEVQQCVCFDGESDPAEVQQRVSFDGDYDKHMWNVAGRNQIQWAETRSWD